MPKLNQLNFEDQMRKISSKKTTSQLQEIPLKILEVMSKIIAFFVCIALLLVSSFIVFGTFVALFNQNYTVAIHDGLFVLILLEMFYVIRSFMRYGSINVSLIVNVGIIAAIKEMIFQLNNLTLQVAISFGVIFVTLGFTYFMEQLYYKKLIKEV